MSTFVWVILFIIILLLCVTIHEFGHFISAKIVKVKIHEFAIGFGPKIFAFHAGKERILISIRALPLGGYVLPASKEISPTLFPNDAVLEGQYSEDKKWYWRIWIALMGVIFNVLFALVISLFFFTISNVAIGYGEFLNRSFVNIFKAIGKIFIGDLSQTESIPKAITSLSGNAYGLTIFSLLVSLNINLAIFNLIPIPPLDGWRFVEIFYEKIMHKPMPINVRTALSLGGISLLFGLSILLIIRDFI